VLASFSWRTLNHHLWTYLAKRNWPVEFTRSRPYHKDGNAHVEQKNWSWSRQLLGYGRLEEASRVAVICEIYKEIWGPLQNFFLPCLKLKRKWREGSHWRKRYELPRTAYQRLCEHGMVARKQRDQLRDRYQSLDPFVLKDQLETRLKHVLGPPAAIRHHFPPTIQPPPRQSK
jgi:hypothetical protein